MSLKVDIEKTFKGFALRLAFEKSAGHLGILGASGCGKSMTLKCIAGLIKPDKGGIVANGRVLFDSEKRINIKPQLRRTGYLFQSYALFPNMTTEQNILCAMAKGQSTQKLGEVMELLHLQGLEKRYPAQLSGGQQQRVALARILAYDPEMLLLDEPFSALDSYLRDELQLQLLEIFSHFDKDIILVTHNRDEAYRLCDTLLVIDGGRALAIGETKEIFRSPRLVAVARLTGCKNISSAKKIDDYTLFANDWGVTLHTTEAVGTDVTHVGIREQDLIPADGEEENLFDLSLLRVSEDPLESSAIFSCHDTGGELWWKYPRRQQMPESLRFTVDSENVLPLVDH